MKAILSLIISGALVVLGFGQTRNVLVGTNNAVVQPTNFWSADASNARTGLGLGSAATNPASAFQPSSTVLSNLSLGNGSGLTNVTASAISSTLAISNIAGLQAALDGKVSTNGSASGLTGFPSVVLQTNSSLSLFPAGLLRTNGDAIGLTNFPVISVASGGTGGTNEQTAREGIGLGATNTLTIAGLVAQNLTILDGGVITLQAALSNAASFRTNIGLPWSGLTSGDAPSFRTALGLGTAATSAVTSFQASSSALTNLAANNGGALTNLSATSIVGIIPATNIDAVNFTNIGGTLSIASGGTGATNAANARQNLGSTTVGDAVFIATNAAAARDAIGALATNGNATNLVNFPALLLRTNGSAAGLTDFPTVPLASNITGTIAISNGGSGATTAGGARTNLGLGATNNVAFQSINTATITSESTLILQNGSAALIELDDTDINFISSQFNVGSPIGFVGTNAAINASTTRTNLGLGWSALTNTTASGFQTALFGTGTNPVLVNTNGEVVSPTNFWQEAPITTTFIESQPTTNSSTNISPSRLLHIHSLATNVVNTTNTIILPTNALTFEGDMALVVHKGPTNSLTQVRQSGSTNNLITLNKFNEAVEFTYYNNNWQFLETVAFTAPIYFSGTNATANAAASRTNLGLGNSSSPEFASLLLSDLSNTNAVDYAVFVDDTGSFYSTSVGAARTNLGLGATWLTNTDVTNFRSAIGLGATNDVVFNSVSFGGSGTSRLTNDSFYFSTNLIFSIEDASFAVPINALAGLTNNGDITINQTSTNNGLLFIRRTNNEPFLGLANLIASNNVTVSNETLFRVGVSEATNKAAQFGFRSTNTNGNGVAVFSVFGYNALMMVGPSDPAAGTNPIQATVYSIAPTNKVMTLITTNTGATLFHRAIEVEGTTNQAVTRTNLGIPLAALTNTNNAGFQRAIFQTNTTPTNGANLGDAKAWIEISVVTNSVTNSYRIPVFQ